ncbi:MAG TPA: LysR family transcriptional regulator [Nevskiaceae bacterium]|nr:LysR family transcriptional regulator [Nevskiaceae bacterium]
MAYPRISLEQWRALVAVVEAGGYAQAAEALHKSQSAVSYAVQKLESVLGVQAFEIHGRKAQLTATGQLLYRRARALLDEALAAERAAAALSAGWEAELRLAVEIVFPTSLLLEVLARFGTLSPHTRIELYESVLGGTAEALLQGRVDLAIGPSVPPGFLGDPLLPLDLVPAAHPDHPLHRLGRPLRLEDLRAHRQLVVRDSGSQREKSPLALEAKQRWTVSHMATSMLAARAGHGYGWYPLDKMREEIAAGQLKPLPMREGGRRIGMLYLIYADREAAGPGALKLGELLREAVQRLPAEPG